MGKGFAKDFKFDDFVNECKELGVEEKEYINPNTFFGGSAILPKWASKFLNDQI